MKLMYDYIIAFKYNADEFLTTCEGTMPLSRVNKIDNFVEYESTRRFIEDHLKSRDGFTNVRDVGIYNIILLGRNKHED